MRLFFVFLQNELKLVLRNHESLFSIFFFSFLLNLLFVFGFPIERSSVWSLALTFIWLTTLFGGILRMNRTFEAENEGGVLDGIRMMREAYLPFFGAKLFINFVFILILEVISTFFVILFFNPPDFLSQLKLFVCPLGLGALGLAVIGTTFSGMLVSHKRKELILPVISYPLMMPLIIGVLKGGGGDLVWLKLLGGFDVIYLIASLMVYETLLES